MASVPNYHLAGIDVGSTTVKLVLLDKQRQLVHHAYQRHYSDIRQTLLSLFEQVQNAFPTLTVVPVITGSGGLALSELLSIPFEQEVIASSKTITTFIPQTDVAIELGGEDAKLTYFDRHGVDQRMNNSCAGGTGAFIDQMASLLETDAAGLNQLANDYQTLYPIASRCGVFAKTDVQPLINQGAAKSDIAASILQAIVNQTISGLACGKPIRGNVAFLGGPLYFLDNLRKLFIKTLKLKKDKVIFPENPQLFVAIGAALLADKQGEAVSLSQLIGALRDAKESTVKEVDLLPPLFQTQADVDAFRERHAKANVTRIALEDYRGRAYLGIDSGSTTTKVVLIGERCELLYDFYGSNKGNPLNVVREVLCDIYRQLPAEVTIAKAATTGYGEQLIKAAFRADAGEVETVAHYRAAEQLLPGVEFILDIGGQDMKCLYIRDGVINSILLNEACSAGCGSFIEMFARSLNIPVTEFSQQALLAERPVDLGTRCTVFMNSKVKQAQKEGATVADISAGLSYSVIKNALYKVIKLKQLDMLPQKIMVQGGTFYNEAVLRAFENLTERSVTRVDIAGLMGAYGAALIARDGANDGRPSQLLHPSELEAFGVEQSSDRCRECNNQCMLTINAFEDGREFISGNRCEKGARVEVAPSRLPNLYEYKENRVFNYKALPKELAVRGTVGIPRVLNQFENYPFWHTFFTQLGFRVVLSPPSTERLYLKGIETIPSESACYPAKLVHGHIEHLIERKVDRIFFPSVTYEWQETQGGDNHFNCPVVSTYSEVIRTNIDAISQGEVAFHNPFINFNHLDSVEKALFNELRPLGLKHKEIKQAVQEAWQELQAMRQDVRNKGKEVVNWLVENDLPGIVLAGRPYHVDSGIHHGIDRIIVEEGMAVLTEDSVAHLGESLLRRPLRVVDQWAYHSRLYAAGAYVAASPQLELVQLTSFGCGLDALTADQVEEVLRAANKVYTLIKIDEGANLGAVRIRIRSLKAAMAARRQRGVTISDTPYESKRTPFTEAMRDTHTILAPQMAPIHFDLIQSVFRSEGYRLQVLPTVTKSAIEQGLKYVNNDACYPCVLVTGQIVDALTSGQYDPHTSAAIITQTGGACRATNYIAFIRKALEDAGFPQVPVISLSASGLEENPGFRYSLRMVKKAVMSIIYGDLLMKALLRTRPYEAEPGSAQSLYEYWNQRVKQNLEAEGSMGQFKEDVAQIVAEFDRLPLRPERRPRVGIVGEILVKYHPGANNDLVGQIEAEGGEAVVPDMLDFFLSCTYGTRYDRRQYGLDFLSMALNQAATSTIEWMRKSVNKALKRSQRFCAPPAIAELASMAESVVSLGNQAGEGWLLTAEMMELLEMGVNNVVCVQPFGCLPNHITGRGVIKSLKQRYPAANIFAIDYDPGASEVNQLNRLKLMMSVAQNAIDIRVDQESESKSIGFGKSYRPKPSTG
ncbi:acyl-CoA dehydratase activase-related protein [Leminorella grimontii]|uniref:acyl-CoA dehydratase activase-related protein n=1 Tax=Leminorella grimontii TaxID=82981 RepID=UPI00322092DA